MKIKQEKLALTCEALAWLRFGKRLDYVTTEWNGADVVGMGGELHVEVEVKISKSDFLRDFEKWKHALFLTGNAPNYFYFFVPQAIADWAIEQIDSRGYAKYGVVALRPDWTKRLPGKRCAVVRKAQRLSEKTPTQKDLKSIIQRCSSAYVGMMHKMLQLDVEVADVRQLLKTEELEDEDRKISG